MTGVHIRREMLAHRHTWRENDAKRHRENPTTHETNEEIWSRYFPHSPWEELTLPTLWFQISSLLNFETTHFCC